MIPKVLPADFSLAPPLFCVVGTFSLGHWARFPVALYWTGTIVVLSLFLWGASRKSRWKESLAWFALALGGQACALQLLDVGPQIRLQLFYEWRVLLGSYRIIFLLAVMLQAAVAAWGLRNVWPSAKPVLRRLLNWRAGLVLAALMSFSAITIAPGVAQALVQGGFVEQVARHATKVSLALLVYTAGAASLILAVATIPANAWNAVVVRWRQSDRKRLPWLCALWVVAVSSLLAWLALDHVPHVPDEVAYLFQAKYVSTGRLYLPPPPDVEAFSCRFCLVDDGRWYSAMLGGWPFLLAAGYRLGLPWFVNPVLGGFAVLLAHALVRRLYARDVADGTALLLSTSPWLLFMSASLMPHPLSLVLTLVGLLGVERARKQGHVGWGAAAGLSFGALLHVRPLEAVAVAIVAALWWLSAGWQRLRLAAVTAALVTGLMMTGLFLAYNKALTGDARLAPVNKFFDKTTYPGSNRLGFGAEVGNWGWTGLDALPGHGPIDVMMNTNHNVYMVNFELFSWPCASLVFVFLLFVWRGWRRNELMWTVVFSVWAAMSLYWFSGGPDFGARYWYQVIFPLTVLTVRGAEETASKLSQAAEQPHAGQRVWALLILASLVALVNVLPWRSLDKYLRYRDQGPDVRRLAREHRFGRSLVFIRGKAWPDYASAFALNPPTLDGDASDPIYALDLGPEAQRHLRALYPDRPVWVIAGPSETGSEFKIIERPASPGSAQD